MDKQIATCIAIEAACIGLMWWLSGWQGALFLAALLLAYIFTPPSYGKC